MSRSKPQTMQGVYAAILLQPGKKKGAHRLYEDQVEPALVRRHGGNASALLVDLVPRELAAAGIDIDVGEREPALTLPEEANRPEEEDDGEGKVRHEEALGIVEAAGDGQMATKSWAMRTRKTRRRPR